jgi:hypothetical protein
MEGKEPVCHTLPWTPGPAEKRCSYEAPITILATGLEQPLYTGPAADLRGPPHGSV